MIKKTFDWTTDIPSQLRLESNAPAQSGFKLTTLVITAVELIRPLGHHNLAIKNV